MLTYLLLATQALCKLFNMSLDVDLSAAGNYNVIFHKLPKGYDDYF